MALPCHRLIFAPLNLLLLDNPQHYSMFKCTIFHFLFTCPLILFLVLCPSVTRVFCFGYPRRQQPCSPKRSFSHSRSSLAPLPTNTQRTLFPRNTSGAYLRQSYEDPLSCAHMNAQPLHVWSCGDISSFALFEPFEWLPSLIYNNFYSRTSLDDSLVIITAFAHLFFLRVAGCCDVTGKRSSQNSARPTPLRKKRRPATTTSWLS